MTRQRPMRFLAPLVVMSALSVACWEVERESNTITGQNQGGCSACKDVVAVRVNPLHTTLLVGETRELIGEPVNAQGVILIGRTISWKSSDEDVVKVTSVGIVSGLAVGNVTISVTVSDVVGTAFVVVGDTPAGE